MGLILPKPTAMGVVDLAFLVLHGRRVDFPGTGYEAYVVEVVQEACSPPDGVYVDPTVTGTLLYIYNVPPNDITNLKEAK